MKEITIFKSEIKNTTWFEWTIKPTFGLAFKASLVGLGALGLGLGAKYSVDFINDTMTPTYIVNGNSNALIEDKQEWVRQTNWKPQTQK